jgi:hypothetical protein
MNRFAIREPTDLSAERYVHQVEERKNRSNSSGLSRKLFTVSSIHSSAMKAPRDCMNLSSAAVRSRPRMVWQSRMIAACQFRTSGSLSMLSPNAAVERPRDELSSAPRVHNEMTHMRRARDAA